MRTRSLFVLVVLVVAVVVTFAPTATGSAGGNKMIRKLLEVEAEDNCKKAISQLQIPDPQGREAAYKACVTAGQSGGKGNP